jgi:hypothetical protein
LTTAILKEYDVNDVSAMKAGSGSTIHGAPYWIHTTYGRKNPMNEMTVFYQYWDHSFEVNLKSAEFFVLWVMIELLALTDKPKSEFFNLSRKRVGEENYTRKELHNLNLIIFQILMQWCFHIASQGPEIWNLQMKKVRGFNLVICILHMYACMYVYYNICKRNYNCKLHMTVKFYQN